MCVCSYSVCGWMGWGSTENRRCSGKYPRWMLLLQVLGLIILVFGNFNCFHLDFASPQNIGCSWKFNIFLMLSCYTSSGNYLEISTFHLRILSKLWLFRMNFPHTTQPNALAVFYWKMSTFYADILTFSRNFEVNMNRDWSFDCLELFEIVLVEILFIKRSVYLEEMFYCLSFWG